MATTCPGCGKTVSDQKATCYLCGAFLAPRLECPKCKRAVPQTRTTCHFCGTGLAGAKLADPAAPGPEPPAPGAAASPAPPAAAKPAAPTPAAPAALIRPDIQLEERSAFAIWCDRHQATIDLTLFIAAAPIAVLAMGSQIVIGTILRMMSAGRGS